MLEGQKSTFRLSRTAGVGQLTDRARPLFSRRKGKKRLTVTEFGNSDGDPIIDPLRGRKLIFRDRLGSHLAII
jgi:hypothetical protein